MTSGSADQTPSERRRDVPEDAAEQERSAQPDLGRHERFGPLELLRTRKADGRALLLFSHRGEARER